MNGLDEDKKEGGQDDRQLERGVNGLDEDKKEGGQDDRQRATAVPALSCPCTRSLFLHRPDKREKKFQNMVGMYLCSISSNEVETLSNTQPRKFL